MKKNLLLLIALLLSACSPTVPTITLTPSPDAYATQSYVTAQALFEWDSSLQATQTALASRQADLESGLADLSAQATQAFATLEAADALNTAIAATNSAVNDNLYAGFATVEAASTLNAAIAATNDSLSADLAVGFATLEAASTANTLEADRLAATALALDATATLQAVLAATPTLPPTLLPPVPASIAWSQAEAPTIELSVSVPQELPGPQALDEHTVFFGSRDNGAVRGITFIRRTSAELLDSQGHPLVTAEIANDPVAVLQAALDDTIAATQTEVTIAEAPTLVAEMAYPAAQSRIALPGLSIEIGYAVLRLEAETWVAVIVQGSLDDITAWMEPALRAIAPLGAAPTAVPPTVVPTETAAPLPPSPSQDNPQDALGVDFTAPAGWTARVTSDPGEGLVSVEIHPDDGQDRMLGLVRATGAELTGVIPDFPAGESDPLAALPAIARAVASSGQGFSEGRYNEIVIGALSGAWTQMRSDTHAQRLYLFPAGAGDWLLVAAQATRDDFSAFGQTELRDFLNSITVRASAGVALGLDFVIPEGWGTGPTTDELLTAEAVRLSPEGDAPDRRAIVLARGGAAGFAAMGLPAGEADPVVALASIVEVVRQEAGFTGGRAEAFQLDTLPGAFAGLRSDTTAMRIYLFRLGDDDWVMLVASANRDAFSTFSRAELHTVLGSLRPAATGGTATLQPIGPLEEVVVAHVSDGDTIYVMLNGREESVRIIGMDTQEAHHPDYGAEWLGYAATHFTEQYVTAGSTVWLESDVRNRDDYGRLLRYVWIKDAGGHWIMLEAELIRAGLAHVRTYDEDRYVAYFHALEREAQAARLGVWGTPPTPPVEPVAVDQQQVWAINPDGDVIPMLFDAAALGNVPDPVAYWPNHVQAIVEDVYYVYPEDIDPATGRPVSEDKVGYWYWLEINDFRGWVPEAWILTEEPEWTYPAPQTDIINYSEPFVLGNELLDVVTEAGGDEVVGTLEPGSRAPVDGLGIDPATGDWWLRVDTQGVDGWVPLTRLSRMRPAS